MEYIIAYIQEFWRLTLEMAPWLLLGFLIAGLLKAYFPNQKMNRYLGKNDWKSVVKAAFIGVPIPLCSCGVIPTGVGFYKNGASAGATNAFLISTPQTGVDSILATQALMGWPLAIIRPFVAFITGIFGGILTNYFKIPNPNQIQETDLKPICTDNCHQEKEKKQNKLQIVLEYAFVEMVQDIGKWLIIGLALAALIGVLIPDNFFDQYLGNPWLEMLIVLAISVPLYVCATGSIPLATSLILKGISPGAALVFLMAGPATNMATLTVLNKAIGKKFTAIYLFSIVFGALFFGILVNMIFPHDFLLQYIQKPNHEHGGMQWFSTLSAIILTGLLIYALIIKKYIHHKTPIQNIQTMTSIKVEGMTCNHCKANVEKNVAQQEGVSAVTVNLETKEVLIEGTPNVEKVKDVINNLGYQVIE